MYLNDGGANWSVSTNWAGNMSHCDWQGITCSATHAVTEINLQNNNLDGPYPTDLYSLGSIATLDLSLNSLVGVTPDDICSRSVSNALFITGDATNCPNSFDTATGQYLEGCCDVVQA